MSTLIPFQQIRKGKGTKLKLNLPKNKFTDRSGKKIK